MCDLIFSSRLAKHHDAIARPSQTPIVFLFTRLWEHATSSHHCKHSRVEIVARGNVNKKPAENNAKGDVGEGIGPERCF